MASQPEEKEIKNGRVELTFAVNDLEGIKQWIYRWIPYVEVVEPIELREEVRYELKEATKDIRLYSRIDSTKKN